MNKSKKSIGIWGFGIVGKAAARYFTEQGTTIAVLDKRELSKQEQELLKELNASYCRQTDQNNVITWLKNQSCVLASPGVDIRPYLNCCRQFMTELDLFYQSFGNPIIAVTGSVGKTTVTTLLSSLMRTKYTRLWTGGNIGTGMLDAVGTVADAALLELSSFQLEYCNQFAPDLAIVTNFYPNHIDRHGSLDAYFQAKKKILAHQKPDQHAIIPLSLRTMAGNTNATISYTATPEDLIPDDIQSATRIFYARGNKIMLRQVTGDTELISISDLSNITFVQNWITICAALYILEIPLHTITEQLQGCPLPAHRLELVRTMHGVDFYNDSKGTTPAATLAAVQKLHANDRPVILILGGLSKGIDREPLIKQLKNNASFIYCVGKERDQLASWCKDYGIDHISVESIEAAVKHFQQCMKPGDQFLLSPAGSSFDQFKDYQERGDHFKKFVLDL